jgi:thioredoxin 2
LGVDPAEVELAQVEDLVRRGGTALVEFWADWCLFSRLVKPKTARLAALYGSRLWVARCRIAGDERALEGLAIRALPMVVLWHRGRVRRRWQGDRHVQEFVRGIESLGNGLWENR